MHDCFHICHIFGFLNGFIFCDFLFRQQGAWKIHYLKISLRSLLSFFLLHLNWTLWIAPRLDVVFLWIRLHRKDNWIVFVFVAWSTLSPVHDTLLMSSKMPLYLTIEGTYSVSTHKNNFSSERFSVSHWQRLQRVQEWILYYGRLTVMIFGMWRVVNGNFFFFFLNDCFSCAVPLGSTLSPVQDP